MHTKHVSGPRLEPENFLVLQRIGKLRQEAGASLQAVQGVLIGHLQATCHGPQIHLPQAGTVDLERLVGRAAEQACFEHLQAGDGQALATAIDLTRLLAAVLPLGAGARVQQDRDEEQVDQAARTLLVVDCRRPRLH